MSLAEWTATSIRPASSASSISLTKTPRAPISPNGRVRSRSPAVVIGTSAISTPGRRRASAACSACVSASLLPRVPTWSSIVSEPEQVPQGVRIDRAVRPGRGLLHLHRRPVEQLVDDARGHRLDRAALRVTQPLESRAGALELALANLLGERAERGDRGNDVARGLPGAEPLRLVE